MPRKIRQLLADLRKAGYVELPRRGRGAHRVFGHPLVADIQPTIPGNDGDDARPYLEKQVGKALAAAEAAKAAQPAESE